MATTAAATKPYWLPESKTVDEARSGLHGIVNKAALDTEPTYIRHPGGERPVAVVLPVGHAGEVVIPPGVTCRHLLGDERR